MPRNNNKAKKKLNEAHGDGQGTSTTNVDTPDRLANNLHNLTVTELDADDDFTLTKVDADDDVTMTKVVANDDLTVTKVDADDDLTVTELDADDDPFPAVGFYPYSPPNLALQCNIDFPRFFDDDLILYYQNPFSLASWMKLHEAVDSRWCPQYTTWSVSDQHRLSTISDWNVCKLGREALAVVQSLICGVVEYWDNHGPHGKLGNLKNYILSQYVQTFGGSKKVRFITEIVGGVEEQTEIRFAADIRDFVSVLRMIFDGNEIDDEIKFMFEILSDYPFDKSTKWKRGVLQDYPGLWNSGERANFYIHMLIRKMYNQNYFYDAFLVAGSLYPNLDIDYWFHKIPPRSVFDDLLRNTDFLRSPEASGSVKYSERSIAEAVRYVTNVLENFWEKKSGANVDSRYIESALSQIFKGLPVAIFCGMNHTNTFM